MIDPVRHLFDYDASRPLDLRVVRSERRDDATVTEVRFSAARGGEVEAFVVETDGAPRGPPGVVYAHGGTEPAKHIFVDQAVELARAGMTVRLPDTSVLRSGDPDRDARSYADAVLVQRRSLDALAERGASRFGHFGHSLGASEGAVLSTVEPRLDAIVIAAMGTGLVERFRRHGFTDEAYLQSLARLDPAHYVSLPGRRRLLFQHGTHDDAIPIAAGRAMFAAAAEPKQWAEYDCDHLVDAHPPALADRIAFFREVLAA